MEAAAEGTSCSKLCCVCVWDGLQRQLILGINLLHHLVCYYHLMDLYINSGGGGGGGGAAAAEEEKEEEKEEEEEMDLGGGMDMFGGEEGGGGGDY